MQDSRREGTGPERADVISAEPRALAFRPAWGLVAALLVAALAAALVVTLHYRGEAAAARRQLQSVTGPAPAGPAPAGAAPAGMASLRLSTSTAGLLAAPPLSGEVTVFAVRSSSGLARVVVTARITGGQPDARYELLGGDCAGDSPDHSWAVGTTDARGSAGLTGGPWTVPVSHRYYLVLSSPGSDHPGPAVHGYFGRAHGLSPVRGGVAPCIP